MMTPGPGLPKPAPDSDIVTVALSEPRKMLAPMGA
jgi:hypothetical protein